MVRLQGVLSSASAVGQEVIVAGDMNGVFNPSLDCVPGVHSMSPDTALMQFMAQQGLVDTFHMLHPEEHSL